MTILETAKALLGISDETKDVLLQFYIDSLTNKILAHTRQEELPTELETFVTEKVVARYNAAGGSATGGVVGQISSIKRGDFQANYKTGVGLDAGSGTGFGGASIDDFTGTDLKILEPFTLIKFT